MYFDAETNFRYSTQAEWEGEMTKKIDAAVAQSYCTVKRAAIADSTSLLKRASLDLGTSPNGLADLPTDQRVTNARTSMDDLQLITLIWNYGRHMLVASSRESGDLSMPANLQGVWNNATSASWGGKFTININIEVNIHTHSTS